MTRKQIERDIAKLADQMIDAALSGKTALMAECRDKIAALRKQQAGAA